MAKPKPNPLDAELARPEYRTKDGLKQPECIHAMLIAQPREINKDTPGHVIKVPTPEGARRILVIVHELCNSQDDEHALPAEPINEIESLLTQLDPDHPRYVLGRSRAMAAGIPDVRLEDVRVAIERLTKTQAQAQD